MKMKTLMTAAEAAGYAMAPYEEHFHTSEDLASEPLLDELDSGQPEQSDLPSRLIARASVAETWLKGSIGGYLGRRAPA